MRGKRSLRNCNAITQVFVKPKQCGEALDVAPAFLTLSRAKSGGVRRSKLASPPLNGLSNVGEVFARVRCYRWRELHNLSPRSNESSLMTFASCSTSSIPCRLSSLLNTFPSPCSHPLWKLLTTTNVKCFCHQETEWKAGLSRCKYEPRRFCGDEPLHCEREALCVVLTSALHERIASRLESNSFRCLEKLLKCLRNLRRDARRNIFISLSLLVAELNS